MMISSATVQALNEIDVRESELQAAFTPGADAIFSENATQASLEPDLSPLSVALQGNAYFVLRDVSGREMLTRNGVFAIVNGSLVDQSGTPVLGFKHSDVLTPLTIDPIDNALDRVRNLHIDNKGELAYERMTIDPATRQTERSKVVVGKLALARFSAATRLHEIDPTHWQAPDGVPPHLGMPADGNFLTLATHARQRSRIDLLTGIDRLQESYMAFDALKAANTAQGRTEKIAMDLLK